MKNENGSGSVYKLSGKRRKPWAAAITTGYTIEGKQVRKLVGTFEKKKEAQEALFNYIKNPQLYSKKTFREIREMWWESYLKKDPSPSTIKTNTMRANTLSALNDMPIADIKVYDMQKVFDDMETSWNYRRGCRSILSLIFDYAVKNEFVSVNRVEHIELGKKEVVIERKIFSSQEIKKLWNNLSHPHVYAVLILLYTGMRAGEILNLKNEDIDLEKRLLHVRVSKTANGIRVIPIPSRIYNIISENIVKGQKYFLKAKHEQMHYETLKDRFEKVMRDLELYPHTIHDTRHTFATLLNNANANSTSIAKLVGHSDFSLTEAIYTHKDTEELRKAIELIC